MDCQRHQVTKYNREKFNSPRLMVGYGAHTRVPHMASTLFRVMAYWVDNIIWVMEAMGLHQFMPANWFIELVASKVL